MATTKITTKVLLPRANLADWQNSSRVLSAGELVLAYDGTGKFRLFEGDNKTFHEGVKELKLEASQVVLSNDAEITVQQAIDSIKATIADSLSAVDGTGVGVVTGITDQNNVVTAEFTNLSGTQTASGDAAADKAVVLTSVTQDATGKITAVGSTAVLTAHQSLDSYYTKTEVNTISAALSGAAAAYADQSEADAVATVVGQFSDLSGANTVYGAKKYADDAIAAADVPGQIATAINALDVTAEQGGNTAAGFVTTVTETDGKVSVTKKQAQLSDLTDYSTVALNGTGSDTSADLTLEGVKKYADGTALAHANAAESNANYYTNNVSAALSTAVDASIKVVTDDLTANYKTYAGTVAALSDDGYALKTDISNSLTGYYQKSETSSAGEIADGLTTAIADAESYADDVSASLVGSDSDNKDADTIYGAKKYADFAAQNWASNAVVSANAHTDAVSAALSADYVGKIAALDGSLTSYVEKANLSIAYDSTNKKIYLSGGTNVSEIDASDFIKDGMLSNATYDSATKNIILSFNTDSGTSPISVNVSDLVDTYKVNNNDAFVGLSLSANEISATIKDDSITMAKMSSTDTFIFDCNTVA